MIGRGTAARTTPTSPSGDGTVIASGMAPSATRHLGPSLGRVSRCGAAKPPLRRPSRHASHCPPTARRSARQAKRPTRRARRPRHSPTALAGPAVQRADRGVRKRPLASPGTDIAGYSATGKLIGPHEARAAREKGGTVSGTNGARRRKSPGAQWVTGHDRASLKRNDAEPLVRSWMPSHAGTAPASVAEHRHVDRSSRPRIRQSRPGWSAPEWRSAGICPARSPPSARRRRRRRRRARSSSPASR